MPKPARAPTTSVDLPGGQSRAKQLILYIAKRCEGARYFGAIKLNKILWKSDFDSFLERGIPVTGREYRRQKLGPTLHEMVPIQEEMLRVGAIRIEPRDLGDGFVEKRTIAIDVADLSLFSETDIALVDRAIQHYWEKTGTEASDESHGIAWHTRSNGDTMPYECAMLSDHPLGGEQLRRISRLVQKREMTTA